MRDRDSGAGSDGGSDGKGGKRTREPDLRRILETISQGVIEVDANLRVRFFNRRARELLGLPEGVLRTDVPLAAIHDHIATTGEYDGTPDYLATLIESGGTVGIPAVYESRRADGRILEISAIELGDGGFVHTFADVTERRRNEDSVRESERRYRLLADNSVDVIVHSDLNAIRQYVSPSAVQLLGYTAEELTGGHPGDLFHPDDVGPCLDMCRQLYSGNIGRMVQPVRYRHKAGHWIWTEVSTSLAFDRVSGARIGFIAIIRDIEQRRKAEEALRISEERLSLALGVGNDGLWDWDLASDVIAVSPDWVARVGWGPGAQTLASRRWYGLVEREDRAQLMQHYRSHVMGETPTLDAEVRLRGPSGTIWILLRGKVVDRAASGLPTRIIGTFIDISQRKEAERQVRRLALHDALTDLPNRIQFRQRLDDTLGRRTERCPLLAVLVCGIDRFKSVNDTVGYAAGDMLLRVAAARIRAVAGKQSLVARLGGDEFAVLIHEVGDPHEAMDEAQRIIEAVGEPTLLGGKVVEVGASVGIAIGSRMSATGDEILRQADAALRQAKADGRNVHRVFAPDALARLTFRSVLALDMREAIRRGEFRLAYQPVIELATGRVSGFEALMRWRHADRGEISPAEFIPVAEESGLIVQLGAWALRQACREAMSWPDDVRIAVNVSPIQFREDLQRTVTEALRDADLPARRLKLEVTESLLMLDTQAVLDCLHQLRNLGVNIALDDFGTGFSSLSYLRRFRFDNIKIDRTFIREIEHPDTAAIVRAIVGIGGRLGMTITAEGVETRDQLDRVRDEGCTEVQGYYFSKPLEAADAAAYAVGNRPGAPAARAAR